MGLHKSRLCTNPFGFTSWHSHAEMMICEVHLGNDIWFIDEMLITLYQESEMLIIPDT